MFCPRCGHESSNGARFCSSCGLPLHVVAEVVANDGLAMYTEAAAPAKERSPRQKGMRLGAKIIFLSAFLLPIFLIMSIAVDEPAPLLVPLSIFFIGLSWRLYSHWFRDEFAPAASQHQPRQLYAPPNRAFVPPAKREPVYDSRRVSAPEAPQPPSVTDHTTQLFD
jgi:hypothetical protein